MSRLTERALIEKINRLRGDFNQYLVKKEKVPRRLAEGVVDAACTYRKDAVTSAFSADITATVHGIWDFSRTRAAIDENESTLIIGALQNPYNQLLGLDCLICEQLTPDVEFFQKYPGSFARVIALKASSNGFLPNSCVAIFGEHFVTPVGVEQDNKACYFVDRFVARYHRVTKSLMARFIDPSSLLLARSAGDDIILRAMCVWLHMHEYSHRLGFMPLPKHLDVKTSRDAASVEELRVDILTVLSCFEMFEQGHPDAAAFAEIVFTERCFRYAVQYDINENYDARGCAILFNWLVSMGAIKDGHNGLVVAPFPALVAALRTIISTIDNLEATLTGENRSVNAQQKTRLVRSYLDWKGPSIKYVQHPWMRRISDEMAGRDMQFSYTN